jgi:hypothetical protein
LACLGGSFGRDFKRSGLVLALAGDKGRITGMIGSEIHDF